MQRNIFDEFNTELRNFAITIQPIDKQQLKLEGNLKIEIDY